MNRDVLAGLGLVGIAVAYWLGANAIPPSVLSGQVPADGLPKLLAWCLGGLGVILTGQGVLARRPAAADTTDVAEPGERTSDAQSSDVQSSDMQAWQPHLRALGMLAFAAGYILLVPYLGYLVSVALLMAGVALYNGAARSPRVIVAAVVGAMLFYVMFVHLLKVPLPPGIWPDLMG